MYVPSWQGRARASALARGRHAFKVLIGRDHSLLYCEDEHYSKERLNTTTASTINASVTRKVVDNGGVVWWHSCPLPDSLQDTLQQ